MNSKEIRELKFELTELLQNASVRSLTKDENGRVEEIKRELSNIEKEGDDNMSERKLSNVQEGFVRFLQSGERANNLSYKDNQVVVPKEVLSEVMHIVRENAPLVAQAKVITNVVGDLTLPSLDKMVASYGEEFTAISAQTTGMGGITLKSHLINALAKISNKLINSTPVNVLNEVVVELGMAVADFFNKELINGTKSAGKIEGLIEATQVVTFTTKVSADEVIDAYAMLPKKYADGAIFVCNRAMFGAIKKLKDGAGQYLISFDNGLGYSILGCEICVDDNCPADTAFFVGKEAQAVKIDENLAIQVLRERYADENAVGVKATLYADAKIRDQKAVVKIVKGE